MCASPRATFFVYVFTEPELCTSTIFLSGHTQNGHLADSEETFAEADKVFRLELLTVPLMPSSQIHRTVNG